MESIFTITVAALNLYLGVRCVFDRGPIVKLLGVFLIVISAGLLGAVCSGL